MSIDTDKVRMEFEVLDKYSVPLSDLKKKLGLLEGSLKRLNDRQEESGQSATKAAEEHKKTAETLKKVNEGYEDVGRTAETAVVKNNKRASSLVELAKLFQTASSASIAFSAFSKSFDIYKSLSAATVKHNTVIKKGANDFSAAERKRAGTDSAEGSAGVVREDEYGFGFIQQQERDQASLAQRGTINNVMIGLKKDADKAEIESDEDLWNAKLSIAGTSAGLLANIMHNLYTATCKKSRAMFETMKAFAIAETVIQTYVAAQGAYAALAKINPALGIAAAAAAIASGMARVKAISDTRHDGGSQNKGGKQQKATPPGGSGTPPSLPIPLEEERIYPTRYITINIHNPLSEQNWAEIAERDIIPALNNAGERNVALTITGV